MDIDNLLNSADFYTYAGFTSSDVNDDYVNFVINKINLAVKQKLSSLFKLRRNQTLRYNFKNSD